MVPDIIIISNDVSNLFDALSMLNTHIQRVCHTVNSPE
jgi:hypothetical protein